MKIRAIPYHHGFIRRDMTPRTKAEADQLGVNRYYTGKPCKNGHISERYVVNRLCIECLKVYMVGYNSEMNSSNAIANINLSTGANQMPKH